MKFFDLEMDGSLAKKKDGWEPKFFSEEFSPLCGYNPWKECGTQTWRAPSIDYHDCTKVERDGGILYPL